MKTIMAIILSAVMLLAGCSTLGEKVDPIATGEIIGFTYLITKDELDEEQREIVVKAYELFSEIVATEYAELNTDTLKKELFRQLDKQFPNEEDLAKRTAIKLMANRYWNKLDAKYSISTLIPEQQLDMLKQVRLGIEQGLGR